MKLHQAASTDKTAMQNRSAATVQRLNKPADMMDNRVTASVQVQRQILSDQSPQAMQLKKHLASLNQAVQRAEDDELVQGKFDTAQRVEEEELIQGRFDTAQCAEDEELLQGKFETAQRVEEEEPLQGKFETVQCAEEDEPIQSKFETAQRAEDDEPLQGKFSTVQRAEDEDLLQGKFDTAQRMGEEEPLQAKSADASPTQLAEQANPKPNNTGLPNQLKAGIESLSGMSMDHVKVHYNSAQPAQLNAHAYAQGSEIHVAPGQEQHLPHEAWHVVQQAQGRVKPTMQMKMGVPVNDDMGLETEADVMGEKAMQRGAVQNVKDDSDKTSSQVKQLTSFGRMLNAYQRKPSSVIQCSAEHYQYVPSEDNCCHRNFYQHLSVAEDYPGSISEIRGATYHTIINMSLFELQNEIALYFNDLPEGEVLEDKVWINTQASYDYVHYCDGIVVNRGNNRINFRAQLKVGGQYEAYHFGQVGAR